MRHEPSKTINIPDEHIFIQGWFLEEQDGFHTPKALQTQR